MNELTTRTFGLTALALLAASGLGCLAEGGGEDLQLTQGAIEHGQLETGYPAVGAVQHPNGHCSGTLIAPGYVLTAKHCDNDGIAFLTGSSPATFKTYPVDARIKHPTLDLEILQLRTPIDDIAPMRFDQSGNLPGPVGKTCTIVGFGLHHEADGSTTVDIKRSATVKIKSSTNSLVGITEVTGMANHGDSGGPLICDGLLQGVGSFGDAEWPNTTVTYYATEEPAWIERTIGPVYLDLALKNGWTNAGFGARSAGAAIVGNVVQLKGAISGGTSAEAFDVPALMAPESTVYLPIDLCDAAKGRLVIQPSGAATVVDEGGTISAAQCFTSLEGVSYVRRSAGATALALQNSWTPTPYGTANPAVFNLDGVVHFMGAIQTTGTSDAPFTLPVGFRPPKVVWMPIDLCGGHKGYLVATPAGAVGVGAFSAWTDAQCFTSLDGASFAADLTGFTPFAATNGWTDSASSTGPLGAKAVSGVVHLKGGIKTTGTNPAAFTLPIVYRPTSTVFAPVMLCGGAKGRVTISPTGVGTISGAGGAFSSASCFTSLDGVTYPLSDATPLVLEDGWRRVTETARPAVSMSGNVVRFRGAMKTAGSSTTAFRMPRGLAPPGDVYVPVTVCGAHKGRLLIQASGAVTVGGDAPFSDAACATSLDGVSFVASTATFFQLPLVNGWANYGSGTRNAAVGKSADAVVLAGAIRTGGTNAVPFFLSSAFRPTVNTYIPVDLCQGVKGRLFIQASDGSVTVQADNGAFDRAQCFTSLEGVTFSQTASGYTAQTLKNGWINAIFSTRAPAAAGVGAFGIVRLQGAMMSGNNAVAFTLPSTLRPNNTVYLPADLCGAAKGRLVIKANGDVTPEVGEGGFSNASCFTSLEGLWFAQ